MPVGAMTTADSQVVGGGWISAEITKTNAEGMWAALDHCIRNPQDFKDVKDVAWTDGPGFLVRTMTINATGKIVEEHIRTDKSKGEMTFRTMDVFTKQETGEERVIAMKVQPLRLEFYSRSVCTGARVHWAAPVEPLQAMIPKLVKQAGKTPVGMGTYSRELTGVTWQSLLHNFFQSFREPQKFFKCDKVVVKEINARQIYREITAFGQHLVENVYFNSDAGEAVCRAVKDGKEVDVERVSVLRTDPMRFEFFQRNMASGERVFWKMGQAIVLGDVEIWLEQARTTADSQAVGSSTMSDLSRFLINDGKVDPCVTSYVTKVLQAESIADFAYLWTHADFEKGMQDDVVSQVKELSGNKMASRLQTARLRAAWSLARTRVK